MFPVTQQQKLLQHFWPLRSQGLSQYSFQFWKSSGNTYWLTWGDSWFDFQQGNYVQKKLSPAVVCPVSYYQPFEHRYDYTHNKSFIVSLIVCLFSRLDNPSVVKVITETMIQNCIFFCIYHPAAKSPRGVCIPYALP